MPENKKKTAPAVKKASQSFRPQAETVLIIFFARQVRAKKFFSARKRARIARALPRAVSPIKKETEGISLRFLF